VLTRSTAPSGWKALSSPANLGEAMPETQYLFIEGGGGAAAAFLAEDMVDRLLLYRAPILIGGGARSIAAIGLASLAAAHDRWQLSDSRQLGKDTLEVYERIRCSQA
jgi:diaminohydroxyphosphoribosylaminopyrimidine deaminase / 5-amino-6-(5-phosphoribosylamino)uracil reductase